MKTASCVLYSLVALSANAAPIVQKRQLEAVTGVVSPVLNTASAATGPVVDTVSPLSKRQLEAVTGVVSPALDTVTSAAGPVVDAVSGVLGKRQLDAVTGPVSPLISTVSSATGPAVDNVSDVLGKRQLEAVTGVLSPVLDTATAATGPIVDTVSGVVGKRQVEGLTGAVQPVLDTVGSTVGQLPSDLGGRIPGVNRRQESPSGVVANTANEVLDSVTEGLSKSRTMGEDAGAGSQDPSDATPSDGTPFAPPSAFLPEQTTTADDSSSVPQSPEGQGAATFGPVSTDEGTIAALSELAKQAQVRDFLAKVRRAKIDSQGGRCGNLRQSG
ncbi:hypothetical protein CERZMDRAFT_120171 [Cercospora zeae-maydis SCOH1-5]|uniref:Uncharacterized protein n=1 Tax=Cercospora zeae-maydis SCOH1-5 TaxID=717836 RepID=A0A6A6FNW1_9PEZI|nr:hypothetical protein CERZMDRAFT_120171 [Cercospora zeae-maydis SCOH1-5]